MRNRLFAAYCLLCAGLLAQTSVHQLRDVKKIYVGTFGNALGSDVIRSKVIAHLVNSHRLEVVENEEQADAILTGDSQVAGEPGKKGYHATAGVRLLAKDSKILWADDQDAFVRAWAAGHLATTCSDYTDPNNTREIRNYEPALLHDPEPIVRAALWSNPQCEGLPWSFLSFSEVSEGWKDQMQRMSQLERLGLMRNPKLSMRYVIALLETPSEELNMTRKEHVDVLIAAAVNPELIGRSRRFGRKAWVVDDFPADPFKEFGKMWQLCLEKWIDDRPVWFFISYIQTTPEVKLAAYTGLLGNTDKGLKGLRQEVIRTCDPLEDAKVLKLA